VASRGKGPEFWQPYVEEWQIPPSPDSNSHEFINKWFGGWFGLFVVKRGMFSDLEGDLINTNFDMDSSIVSYTGLPIHWFRRLCLV
jgi:hypothetical protein